MIAGPRDAQWKAVEDAAGKGLPRSAIEALEPIIAGALADHAYPEAIKAIGRKIALGFVPGRVDAERFDVYALFVHFAGERVELQIGAAVSVGMEEADILRGAIAADDIVGALVAAGLAGGRRGGRGGLHAEEAADDGEGRREVALREIRSPPARIPVALTPIPRVFEDAMNKFFEDAK